MTEGDRMDKTASKAEREGRLNHRRRWLALLLVCAAQLMIVLDGTIVNVALPAIQGSRVTLVSGLWRHQAKPTSIRRR